METKLKDPDKVAELKREDLAQFIEQEIVVRYWFQPAAVEVRLKYDSQLKEALQAPLI